MFGLQLADDMMCFGFQGIMPFSTSCKSSMLSSHLRAKPQKDEHQRYITIAIVIFKWNNFLIKNNVTKRQDDVITYLVQSSI